MYLTLLLRRPPLYLRMAGLTFLLAGASAPCAAEPGSKPLPPCGANGGYTTSIQTVTIPQVGQEREAEVGDSIMSTSQGRVENAMLRITAPATFVGKWAGAEFTATVPPTVIPAPFGDSAPRMVREATFRYARDKGDRHGIAKPDIGVFVDPNDERVLIARVQFGFMKSDVRSTDAQFQVDRCLRLGGNGFRREILYSGNAKGVISLQYREYLNDFARPAFSQELSYDLADGKEIGLKGARIRITKVSNTGLTYTVLKPLAE